MTDSTAALEETLRVAIKEHDPRLDSFLFNGGTILALAATISATAVPWSGDLSWVPRALAGLAAFLIGVERALSFGSRWRYHLRMRRIYRATLARLLAIRALAASPERDLKLEKLIDEVDALSRTEALSLGDAVKE
jgi:hypothetical protein